MCQQTNFVLYRLLQRTAQSSDIIFHLSFLNMASKEHMAGGFPYNSHVYARRDSLEHPVPRQPFHGFLRLVHVTSATRHSRATLGIQNFRLTLGKPNADRVGAVRALPEDRVEGHSTRGQPLQPREQALGVVRSPAFGIVAHSVGDSARFFHAPPGVLFAPPGRVPCRCCGRPTALCVVTPRGGKRNQSGGAREHFTPWIDVLSVSRHLDATTRVARAPISASAAVVGPRAMPPMPT